MDTEQEKAVAPKDTELLRRIEELRTRLLGNDEVRERIALRAYELYQRRGGEDGRDVQDWVGAENEILSPLIEQQLHRSAETEPTRREEHEAGETAESPAQGEEVIEVWEGEGGAPHLANKAKSRATTSRSGTARKAKKALQHDASVAAANETKPKGVKRATKKTGAKRTAKKKSQSPKTKGKEIGRPPMDSA